MILVCLDLEGVLVPEIWIAFAQATGIEELKLTTRDIPDYDALMKRRIAILDEHGLRLRDIRNVIAGMDPLEGAREFLDRLRERYQVVILSDTFTQFAQPLMQKLGWPTLFCNSLVVDRDDRIVGYRLRQPDGKRHAAEALSSLGFTVIAAGDSYNDTSMLKAAHRGIFFRPPASIVAEFPEFPVTESYPELTARIEESVTAAV